MLYLFTYLNTFILLHERNSQPHGLQLQFLDFKKESSSTIYPGLSCREFKEVLSFYKTLYNSLQCFFFFLPPSSLLLLLFLLSFCNSSNALYFQRTIFACPFSDSKLKKFALIAAKIIGLNHTVQQTYHVD